MSSKVIKKKDKTPRSILRKRSRNENVRINSSTSDWTMALEGERLHMNMIESCSFDDLIKSRDDAESLSLMDKAADEVTGDNRIANELRALILQSSQSNDHIRSSPDLSDESTHDSPEDMENLDQPSMSTEKKITRQVTFVDDGADAEMKDTTGDNLSTTVDSASDDGDHNDNTLSSEGSDQASDAHLEAYTASFHRYFLLIIRSLFEDTTGIETRAIHESRKVKTGTSSFTSDTAGSYHFKLPGQCDVSGAEIFGTEDKHRGTSTRNKEKLQIQVAGEMLATALHRDIFRYDYDHADEILHVCPDLQRPQTETSRTVYYLVFTHLGLRIAKAVFDQSYLYQVAAGYLKEHSELNVMWSPLLLLNDEDDLRKAAKLVMCLMLNFKDELQSGLHYWRPYLVQSGERTFRVADSYLFRVR